MALQAKFEGEDLRLEIGLDKTPVNIPVKKFCYVTT